MFVVTDHIFCCSDKLFFHVLKFWIVSSSSARLYLWELCLILLEDYPSKEILHLLLSNIPGMSSTLKFFICLEEMEVV